MCVVELDGSLERKKENDKMGKNFPARGHNFFLKCHNDNKSFAKTKNVLLLLIAGNNRPVSQT